MSPRARFACAAGAAGTATAALCGPVDRLADASFAWHMTQHVVLLFAVPLLALLARPFDLFTRIAPKETVAVFVRRTKPLHVLASPPVAYAIFVAALWGTHFTPLYQLALERPWVHVCEHALYLTAGTIFWLPVVSPPPLRPVSYPIRAFYLFAALPQGALLAATISSARTPLYAHYAAVEPLGRALADQQNAAAVMWIAGGFAIFIALLSTLGVWAAHEAATT